LEKGLKLSYLGITTNDRWQEIPSKEMGVHCCDCVSFMRNNMNDEVVDATITSPPYDVLRNYEGYEFDFEATARELFRVTKTGGVVIWVVGDSVVKGSETGTSFRQALFFQEIGFNIHDTMIYAKTGVSYPSIGRYTQVFEFMFVFSKGKPKTFNPICDIPKLWPRGSWGKTSRRRKDGTLDTKSIREGDGSGFKMMSNIWTIKNGRGFGTKDDIAYQHPATFPEEIPRRHILTWSNPCDLIFDPVCGSGTTLKMALLNGRKFIGVDISQKYCSIAIKRLAAISPDLPLFSAAQAHDQISA
jgi:site-specific DNA-methyltransferase (adenine-specific)